jgi:ferric enterobactin receptor
VGLPKPIKLQICIQNAEGYLLSMVMVMVSSQWYALLLLQGNGDLKPETSINKEIGIQFQKDVVNASLSLVP